MSPANTTTSHASSVLASRRKAQGDPLRLSLSSNSMCVSDTTCSATPLCSSGALAASSMVIGRWGRRAPRLGVNLTRHGPPKRLFSRQIRSLMLAGMRFSRRQGLAGPVCHYPCRSLCLFGKVGPLSQPHGYLSVSSKMFSINTNQTSRVPHATDCQHIRCQRHQKRTQCITPMLVLWCVHRVVPV